MFIVLIAVVLFISSLVAHLVRRRGEFDWDGLEGVLCAFAIGVMIAAMIVFPCARMYWHGKVSKLEAEYEVILANYETTIAKTEALLSIDVPQGLMVAGSVERWEQAGKASQAIIDIRDKSTEYNEKLYEIRRKQKSIFYKWLIPRVPPHLEPFKLE